MKKNIFSYKFILYTIIPGLIIGICNAIGYSLHTSNSTMLDSSVFFRFAFYFVLSVAITSGLYLLFDAMPYKSSRLTLLKYIKTSGQYYRIMVAITFLLWLPSYLAVFPGLFTYDARAQWIRVVFNTVTEHHPVIHTLFAGGTIFELQQLTGSIDFGIAVYSILQLIIFSFLVGYLFLVMYQYHIPLFIRIFSLLLITVYPPVVINILTITKDNYYALFFIGFILINTQLMFDKNFDFNVEFLQKEIKRVQQLGIKKLVIHPGSHVNLGVENGINNIIKVLNTSISDSDNIIICLETMAGKGTEIGRNFNELKQIIDNVNCKDKIGICMDTCHLNDAGYNLEDFDSVLDEFNKEIGLDYLKVIHINDSKNILGSKKDRHENIGYGTIGFNNLINIIYNKRLENVPKILETPYIDKMYQPFKHEIDMIKNKKFNENLFEDVKRYYLK